MILPALIDARRNNHRELPNATWHAYCTGEIRQQGNSHQIRISCRSAQRHHRIQQRRRVRSRHRRSPAIRPWVVSAPFGRHLANRFVSKIYQKSKTHSASTSSDTEYTRLVEDMEGAQCLNCDGSSQQPFVDDYGHEIRWWTQREKREQITENSVLDARQLVDSDIERPCASPTCVDGEETGTERRGGQTNPICALCMIGVEWLDFHCSGEFGYGNITGQIAEHDQELEWPSYADRAIIAAARDYWKHFDASCLRGLVRVATAKKTIDAP